MILLEGAFIGENSLYKLESIIMLQILRIDQGIDNKMEYEITTMIKVAFEKRFDNYERARYISDFCGIEHEK